MVLHNEQNNNLFTLIWSDYNKSLKRFLFMFFLAILMLLIFNGIYSSSGHCTNPQKPPAQQPQLRVHANELPIPFNVVPKPPYILFQARQVSMQPTLHYPSPQPLPHNDATGNDSKRQKLHHPVFNNSIQEKFQLQVDDQLHSVGIIKAIENQNTNAIVQHLLEGKVTPNTLLPPQMQSKDNSKVSAKTLFELCIMEHKDCTSCYPRKYKSGNIKRHPICTLDVFMDCIQQTGIFSTKDNQSHKNPTQKSFCNNHTPLMIATSVNDLPAVKKLLDRGAQATMQTVNGSRAIDLICHYPHEDYYQADNRRAECIRKLLIKKATLEQQETQKQSSLINRVLKTVR